MRNASTERLTLLTASSIAGHVSWTWASGEPAGAVTGIWPRGRAGEAVRAGVGGEEAGAAAAGGGTHCTDTPVGRADAAAGVERCTGDAPGMVGVLAGRTGATTG